MTDHTTPDATAEPIGESAAEIAPPPRWAAPDAGGGGAQPQYAASLTPREQYAPSRVAPQQYAPIVVPPQQYAPSVVSPQQYAPSVVSPQQSGGAVYGVPQYAAPSPYNPMPASGPDHRKTLGAIALIASLVALVGGMIITGFVAIGMSSYMGPALDGSLDTFTAAEESDMVAISNGMISVFLFGSGLGIWAIIQGIVAIVRRRGRAFGIGAIVVAAVAPVFCVIVFYSVIISSTPLLTQPY